MQNRIHISVLTRRKVYGDHFDIISLGETKILRMIVRKKEMYTATTPGHFFKGGTAVQTEVFRHVQHSFQQKVLSQGYVHPISSHG